MRFFSQSLGYDRVLAAVVAAFVSTSAVAQTADAPKSGASDLAIEAAVPVPEPANVPPPTAADVQPAAPAAAAQAEPAKPSEPVKAAEPAKTEPAAAPATQTTTAPAPAAPAAQASRVAAEDQPVADRLRDLLTAKTSRVFDRKGEKAAVEAFYAARDFAPLWIEKGALTDRATKAMARLKAADTDGLDAADYPLPDFAAATTPEAKADAELKLVASLLDFTRHVQSGRVHYSRVSADIAYPNNAPEPDDVLAALASSTNITATLDGFSPPQPGYKALKAKLAEVRGQAADAEPKVIRIPEGKLLRPGFKDSRVPLLRERLGVTEDTGDNYEGAVVEAVKAFQKDKGLNPDGAIGSATLRAFNGPERKTNVVDALMINMERWRWLPRELGEPKLGNAYVMLNIPDYNLRVMQNGKQAWTTRVVVGKPNTATPELSETMKYITVNPTWNVPPSIVYGEYLPALQQDPTVLERMGLRLQQRADGSVHISQPPGERNALGRIRFNFPNKFLVYQHDTPDKHLFSKDTRAYSHGCMRVQNPDQYAEVLLGITLPEGKYSAAKIRSMYGNSEQNINLPVPLPVHIVYHTAFVNDAGQLELRDDIYGRDQRLLAQFKGSDRRVADIAIERPQPNYSRPPATIPNGVAFAGGGYGGSGGPSFLERLFGAPAPVPPQPVRRVYR